MPLVSIIIPVYNTEKYLKACLDSIVNQTYQNIEIIIIEDNSPDNANFILSEYEKNFKNVKVIHNPINLGLATTRNIGLEEANGDYILFVDSDDYIDISTVEKMVHLISQYSVNLIYFNYANILGPIQLNKGQQDSLPVIEDIDENHHLLLDKTGHCCRNFYSHSLIQNLRFPDGLIYEDNAFTYPAFSKAGKILKVNDIYYYYRRNLNSITFKTRLKPTEKILGVYEASDYIKYNCEKLGTYNAYQADIDQIMITISLIPALNATNWLSMKKQDQIQLVQLLYRYSQLHYQLQSLEDIDFIQKIRQKNKMYNLQIEFLQKFLRLNQFAEDNEFSCLEQAKQIIKKY